MWLDYINTVAGMVVSVLTVLGILIGVGVFFWKIHDRIRDLERKNHRYDKYFDAFEKSMIASHTDKVKKRK